MRYINVIKAEEQGFIIKNSHIDIITDSVFRESGSDREPYGFIENTNSNVTITNTIFYGNTARKGAAYYHSCSGRPFCRNEFINVTFENNVALEFGGAIYYDIYRPLMTNVTFKNNSAVYGPNIASYPVKVIRTDTNSTAFTLDNVASGQTYTKSIELSLVDFDNQIASDTNSGVVSVSPSLASKKHYFELFKKLKLCHSFIMLNHTQTYH